MIWINFLLLQAIKFTKQKFKIMITKEDVLKAIANVKHPAIDLSLLELGVVQTVEVENNKAKVTFAFPFANIPIADMLINSVKQPIINLGAEFEGSLVLMTEEEKQRFLMLEQSAWKGMWYKFKISSLKFKVWF